MESSRDSRGDEPQSHTQQGGQHIEKPAHSCPEGHNQVIQDPLAHFLAIPWTAKLLADPAAFDIAVVDRRLLPTGDKQFIRSVLNSPTTVRACVVFWMRMPTTPPAQGAPPISKSRALLQGGGPQNGEDPEKPFLLFNALVDLGEDLCGYRGVLHGGLTAVLLDETMCSVSDSLGCEFSGNFYN
ncbi:uncharacterized protein THITE_2115324 [Thermothielavioides terrestris NRRL 8126]|uniref:Thioesterase domain-containing protein n=1 Tax=Thermothielavioides terrestris (strain ATCC 38088 / NRRL 8126) TaxID=578455 RepID=G2R3Z9_THETT|nr:uncharacterized protein THITE_2115324 [Thermothielavioides terrestris NRRL 8126]AEO66851.1 hypothetical protein THITE_2115324 [Thermothielavioides terrestris NRRL 8126]